MNVLLSICALLWLAGAGLADSLTTAERDRLWFEANRPEGGRPRPLQGDLPGNAGISNPSTSARLAAPGDGRTPLDFPRVVDPEAEVIGPPPIPLPAVTNQITLAWTQPGTCLGWRIERSTNLVTWQLAATKFNDFVRHDSEEQITLGNTFNPVYFRVGAFNR